MRWHAVDPYTGHIPGRVLRPVQGRGPDALASKGWAEMDGRTLPVSPLSASDGREGRGLCVSRRVRPDEAAGPVPAAEPTLAPRIDYCRGGGVRENPPQHHLGPLVCSRR
ncbi:hypothetical protein MRX96_009728 [Rhipicephalus microplus]